MCRNRVLAQAYFRIGSDRRSDIQIASQSLRQNQKNAYRIVHYNRKQIEAGLIMSCFFLFAKRRGMGGRSIALPLPCRKPCRAKQILPFISSKSDFGSAFFDVIGRRCSASGYLFLAISLLLTFSVLHFVPINDKMIRKQ